MTGLHRCLPCIVFCALVLQIGCQSTAVTSPEAAPGCEPLPDWLEKLPPWEGPTLRTTQLTTFVDRHNDAVHILRYDVALSRQSLVMAAQTTLGLPLYESVLRSGCLTVSRNISQLEGLPAVQAVADFVLAYWPLPALSSALEEAGYTLQLAGNQRTLIGPEGEPLVTAVLPPSEVNDTVQIRHFDIPLDITIQTLVRRVDQP